MAGWKCSELSPIVLPIMHVRWCVVQNNQVREDLFLSLLLIPSTPSSPPVPPPLKYPVLPDCAQLFL